MALKVLQQPYYQQPRPGSDPDDPDDYLDYSGDPSLAVPEWAKQPINQPPSPVINVNSKIPTQAQQPPPAAPPSGSPPPVPSGQQEPPSSVNVPFFGQPPPGGDKSFVTPPFFGQTTGGDKPKEPTWKENKWQALARAILGATVLGPEGAMATVHPAYSADMRRYQGQIGRELAEQEAKTKQTTAEATLEGWKTREKESAERIAIQAAAQKEKENQDRLQRELRQKEDAQKAYEAAIAGQTPAIFGPGEEIPVAHMKGWHELAGGNPQIPGSRVFLRSRVGPIPPELSKFVYGYGADEYAPTTELDKASDKAREVEAKKEEGKPVHYEHFTDENSGDVTTIVFDSTGKEIRRQIDKGVAKKRPQVNQFNFPSLTPTQIAAANQPVEEGVKNEKFLASLPIDEQSMVKAISEYRQNLPSGSALGRAPWADLIRKTNLYDPGFDVKLYPSRQKLITSAIGGEIGNNIRSLNTLTGHIESFGKAALALNTHDVQTLNKILQAAGQELGHDAQTNFAIYKHAVASELSTALKGKATEADVQGWLDTMSRAESPEQLRGAVTSPLSLMHTRYAEIRDQFNRDLDPSYQTKLKILSPNAARILREHGFDTLVIDRGSVEQPKQQQQQPQQQPGWPPIGTISKGHRYKGGEPSDKNNWVKLNQ